MITEIDVRNAIKKTLQGQDIERWDLNFNFLKGAMDSLDHATFALLLEERHGLKISDADLDKLNTIRAVLDYAREKVP